MEPWLFVLQSEALVVCIIEFPWLRTEASVSKSLMEKFTSFPRQQVRLIHGELESDVGNCTSVSLIHIMHCHTLRATVSCVSYGIGGWPIFTIQLCRCWERWLQVCQSSPHSQVVCVEGLLWESTPRLLFQALIPDQRDCFSWYIQIYVVPCLLPLWQDMSITSLSLMTF